MKIRRKSLKKPRARQGIHSSHANLDIWLVRGSHIAQVGLFVLTLWTLFYAVIPLYKTAALEEQIARRETELKAFEQKLAETEAALRETNEKAYQRSRADVLWNLHYYASPRCSGLLRRPEELVLSSEKSKPHPDRPLLDINVADCLSVQLAKTKADAVLRPEDLRFLRVAVTRTADALEEQRAKAIEAMLQMETKSTEELYAFAPKSPFAQQMGEWLDMVWQAYPELLPSDPRTGEHSRAVRNAQERIAWNFEEQVRVEIRTLRDIAWPDPDVAK